jgi:hypothetical protein
MRHGTTTVRPFHADPAGRGALVQPNGGQKEMAALTLRDIAAAIVTGVSGEPPEPHPFEENDG